MEVVGRLDVVLPLLLLILGGRCSDSPTHRIIYNEFNPDKSDSGYFVSPNFPEKYPQDVRYFYIFMGGKDQQVQLTFNHFNIEGLSHSCDKDYLDIYIEIKTTSARINISEDLFQEPLLGRYCGHNLQFIPHNIVSKHNTIVLDFFSDKNTQESYNQDDHMGQLGFKGSYHFRRNDFNLKFGTASSPHSCYYLIDTNVSRTGFIQSPNYPGLLPSPLNCTYEFRSHHPSHRVELDFLDFNLFQQDEMCPVEYVEIHESRQHTNQSGPVGGRLCGQRTSYRFVSTHNRAYLRLVVLAGRDYMKGPRSIDLYKESLQNTGFKIKYVFSEYFVSLRKLSNNRNRIRGSECDILIESKGLSSGVLVSAGMDNLQIEKPTFCNYYFFGIHNSQNMETVLLEFTYFNLPSSGSQNCKSGSLSMYSAKFLLKDIIKRRRSVSIDPGPDKQLCGDTSVPFSIRSRSPVFVLRLNVTKMKSDRPIGFKLSYRFLRDFGIPGSMVTEGLCHYQYESRVNGHKGYINSPFYSSFYPNNASCRYDLLARPDEMIRIVFKVFQTAEEVSPNIVSYHDIHLSCHQDFLSVSEIIRTRSGVLRTNSTERYCGTSIPGLLVSQQNSVGFKLIFQSDAKRNGPGFLAKYEFLKKQTAFTEKCGENVTTDSLSGVISSPTFPQRYTPDLICEWHFHSLLPTNRFLLLFTSFQIEGTAKGCSNAVVRLYEGNDVSPQLELCGTDSAIPAYQSKSNFVRVRFLTDVSAKGAKGFQLVWTEILPPFGNGTCQGFRCIHSGHCINTSLTCNRVVNCGSYTVTDGSTVIDSSDEVHACPIKTNHNHLYSGLGVVAIVMFFITSVVLYLIHKNRDLLKKRLKQKVGFSEVQGPQISSSPSHSLLNNKPTCSLGSLRKGPSMEVYRSRNGSLSTIRGESRMNNHKEYSFELDQVSIKGKGRDHADARSDAGSFYREKMQKISIV